MSLKYDIFCKIVDNFGDIGICWRLSKQLANEHGLQVRLFVDDLAVASKIIPNLNIYATQQKIQGIQVASYHSLNSLDTVADVAIETFGCGLPTQYLNKMHSGIRWVNLEYLSAEQWVKDFHAKPSQHPALALTKHFFFPGFHESTGGLIRETDLISKRDAFLKSKTAQQNYWQRILKDQQADIHDSLKVSFFCYPQASIDSLLNGLSKSRENISILIPENSTINTFKDVLEDFKLHSKELGKKNNIQIYSLPFLSQDDYDQLLWSCDLNFVRGEDSWIRALWAGRPFIWQPYIQTDNTHITKLNAFLDFYTESASQDLAKTIKDAHIAWSRGSEIDSIWHTLIDNLEPLARHANTQSNSISQQADLATKLVIFSENLPKNQV